MQPKFCESCNSRGVPMKRAIFSNFMAIHKLPNYVQLISGAITCILVASSLYAHESKVSNGSFT